MNPTFPATTELENKGQTEEDHTSVNFSDYQPSRSFAEIAYTMKKLDNKKVIRKSKRYMTIGIVFFVLAIMFFWTYFLCWLFLFISFIYFSICSAKYQFSQLDEPRKYAQFSILFSAIILTLFCVLFLVGLVVLLGAVLGTAMR